MARRVVPGRGLWTYFTVVGTFLTTGHASTGRWGVAALAGMFTVWVLFKPYEAFAWQSVTEMVQEWNER
jgi:hypothetical protein